MNRRRGRQGRERALIAQDVLRSIFVDSPRDKKSQHSQPRQGRRSSKEHKRHSSKDSRGLPPVPGSILRGGTRHDGSVRWDEWICQSCSKKNFLTNKNCRQCQGLPNEQQKLAGAGGSARHANIPPPGLAGSIGLTAPSPTTGSELKQQVSKLEAMTTAQELGDQELLTNIKDKLRHAQAAKAESRPWEVQLDSALANLEKAKLQIEQGRCRKPGPEIARTGGPGPRNDTAGSGRCDGAHPADGPTAQMRPDQVPQAAGPLLVQLQPSLARNWCQPFENGLALTEYLFRLHAALHPETKLGQRYDGNRARLAGITIRCSINEGASDETPQTRTRRSSSLSPPPVQARPTPHTKERVGEAKTMERTHYPHHMGERDDNDGLALRLRNWLAGQI